MLNNRLSNRLNNKFLMKKQRSNSAIPSDYVVYIQESDYNIGVEHDPKMFSQAVSSRIMV